METDSFKKLQKLLIFPLYCKKSYKNYRTPRSIQRADYNKPRKISTEEMRSYLELIVALKIRSTKRKGK